METNNSVQIEVQHQDVAYEHRDMDHRTVFLFLTVLGLAGLLIHIVVFGLFEAWGGSQFVPHQTTNPIMTSNEQLREIGGDPAVSFPKPQLQPNPVADLNKFRVREDEELNSYGMVDPNAGKVHIPIERAIDILANSWDQQQNLVGARATPAKVPTGQQPGR